MVQERIEIPISRKKALLTLLGAISFVLVGDWMISFADNQQRYPPIAVTWMGYISISFFGIAGLFILNKLFDFKPGLVIDSEGIHDNSNASSSSRLIKWEQIKGIRIEQVKSTKFILVDIHDPMDFMTNVGWLRRTMMMGNYKMYGTPIFILCNSLKCNADYLFKVISERMILEHKREVER